MSFALTAAKAYQIDICNTTNRYGWQVLELTVTRGAATDVTLDVGNPTGTFWTQALASNALGVVVLNAIKPALAQTRAIVGCEVIGSVDQMLRVAAPSATTNYQLTNIGTYPVVTPSIVLFNAVGPAEIKVVLTLSLNDNVEPAEFN